MVLVATVLGAVPHIWSGHSPTADHLARRVLTVGFAAVCFQPLYNQGVFALWSGPAYALLLLTLLALTSLCGAVLAAALATAAPAGRSARCCARGTARTARHRLRRLRDRRGDGARRRRRRPVGLPVFCLPMLSSSSPCAGTRPSAPPTGEHHRLPGPPAPPRDRRSCTPASGIATGSRALQPGRSGRDRRPDRAGTDRPGVCGPDARHRPAQPGRPGPGRRHLRAARRGAAAHRPSSAGPSSGRPASIRPSPSSWSGRPTPTRNSRSPPGIVRAP